MDENLILNIVKIAKLKLEKGDILLVSVPAEWGYEKVESAREGIDLALRMVGIIDVEVVFKNHDIDMKIIRK